MRRIAMLTILCALAALCLADAPSGGKPSIDVFFKNRKLSLQALERVLPIVMEQGRGDSVRLHLITSEENAPLIASYGLPETHFPFAVAIDGHFSAEIDGRRVDFVHFPAFMRGIGRHEGNWSLADLESALTNPSLLLDENTLPHIEDDEEYGECVGE